MRPSAIDRIFITHMHADHVLGLPGILPQTVRTTPLHIYGPLGLRAYIRNTLQSVCTNLQIPYYVHEIKVDRANPDKPIRVLNDGRFEVHAAPIRGSAGAALDRSQSSVASNWRFADRRRQLSTRLVIRSSR
ncbi:Metallo-beta-lactamase domain-containing protein [Plasmodiophora brassicae]